MDKLYIEVKLEQTAGSNGKKWNDKCAFLEIEASDTVTQVKEKVLAELNLGLLTENYDLCHDGAVLAEE